VPDGYGALRLAIMEGRIDPLFPNVTHVMRQGCLRAHLAEHRQCDSWNLPGAARYVIWQTGEEKQVSPAEAAVGHVRYGDKPATCPALKTLLGYMDEWLAARQQVSGEEEFVSAPAGNLVELDNEEF
jgi:hypothetical protein